MTGATEITGTGLTRQLAVNCPQLAKRPGWHGPAHPGHSRCIKAVKRREAKQRQTRFSRTLSRANDL